MASFGALLQLRNETPFTAALFVTPDRHGRDTLLITIQAVLAWGGARLHLAASQRPVPLTDEYWGDPSCSSIRYAGEARLTPPGTDVVIVGEAHTPGLRPKTTCDVSLRVGPLLRTARIVGDRVWERGAFGCSPSKPELFTTMPLRHERAVGGREEPRNPIGCGLRSGRSNLQLAGAALPNVEDPQGPLGSPDERPTPVSFGCIPPAWAPRCGHAGTFDVTWQRTRAPYLPHDLDPRFFHAAAPGLISDAPLRGGEPVELRHLSPRGFDAFTLPASPHTLAIGLGGAVHRPRAQLVTVVLEPTEALVTLVWQTALECDGQALAIEDITVGLASTQTLGGL